MRMILPDARRSRAAGKARRALALTEELVARVERTEPDSGPGTRHTPLSDADYAEAAREFVDGNPGAPLWVFAYGSLIWKPEFEHVEERPCIAHGWRRSFCLHIGRWRATREQPGLMLALDRGGSCQGVALRLPPGNQREGMERLLRRETSSREGLAWTRWIRVRAGAEQFRALAFYVAPRGDSDYIDLPLAEQAARLARAAGHVGSGAIYPRNTVLHLEARGIHDRYLWRLQELVAREIAGLDDPPGGA